MSTQLICPHCECISWEATFKKSASITYWYTSNRPLQLMLDSDKYWGAADDSDGEEEKLLPNGQSITVKFASRVDKGMNKVLVSKVKENSSTEEVSLYEYDGTSIISVGEDDVDEDEYDTEIEVIRCLDCGYEIYDPYNVAFGYIQEY